MFISDVVQFHTSEKIQYTMPIIPRIEEWLAKYKTPSTSIMEPQETFTSKAMKRSSVQVRLLIRAKPSKVEPNG